MTSEDLSLSDPSSDESLSLSSASDEAFSQDEWAVRRILAEAKVQGEIKYLIDWDGFDLCDATWEPAEHLSEGLLADWLTTKKKTGKKTVPGFKIDEWRQAVNDDIRAKYAKHTKRNQQRARLGLGQSELDFTLEQWINSVQGPSEDDTTDTNEEHIQEKYSAPVSEPPTTEPRIIGQSSARINDQSKEQKARSSLRESQGIQDDRTLSIKEGSVLQFECQTSHGPPESPQDSPENEKKSPVQAAQAGLCALDSQKSTLSSTPKSKGAPHQPDSLPKTTVRFRIPSVGSALMPNVFVGGKKRKARQNLLDAASDPSRPPKFLNHHKQRLIEKGLRDKEGVTPPRKEGNEPLRVHPIQAAMQPINTMPTSGKIRGILVPRNSLDRVIPKPSPKKKRVHWEDDLISQKPQIPAELESLFVSDEPSIVALNADFCAMGASTESPSKGAPSFSSAELPPSCDRSTISKPCQFGSPDGLFATLDFRDLQLKNKPSWSYCFDGSDRLVFCHVCTVHDLLSQTACGALEELSSCQGTTSCSGKDKNIVMLVANRLRSGYFAAVCFQNDFCILIFCPSFLDRTDASPDTANSPCENIGLRFLIFKPSPLFKNSMLASINPLSSRASDFIAGSLSAFNFFFGTIYRDLVFSRKDDKATNNFFLVFPPSYQEEAVLISQWLRESVPSCNIKSSLQPGQWSNFLTLDSSIVIFHEEVLWTIPSLPNISTILHSQSWNLECFVLSSSGDFGQNIQRFNHTGPIEGNYRLTQVFSQGTVILLTPSFVVSQPAQAYNFLKWFWQHYDNHGTKHGPARLAVCSDICDWLFDLSQSKGATRGVSEPRHPGIRATERAVEALTKCCNLVQYIIAETENFEEGPLVYAPDVLDGNDEQSLVNWFGSWAMLHIQQFRKFLVLGSSYQTEARLSRVIQPVQFVTCCTEHLPPQDLVTVQTPHYLQPGAASVIPEAMLAAKTGEFLTDIEKGYGGLSFSPLVLYRYPITCWDSETILQLGDCKSCFKDYSNWFNHFKEPFFSRPMGLCSINMLPNYKNTYLGLCYTRDEERKSVCSSSREAQVQNLRPWIAIYRPADIHTRPWKNMELLIWDPLIRNSVFQGNEFYEGELLSAQERLVSYIVDRSQDLKTTLPLERVWVGPFDDHQDDGFVDPFDCVLSWIRTISNSVKERLPLYGKQLSSRGWKQVDLEDLLTRAGEGNVPRQISETQSANKQCLPLRTVFQAPKPNIGARRSPTCNNRLQAAMLRHQDSNEIYFTFQPTLKWYGEQVAAGRGLQHIKVLDWQTFFTRHKIHDPED